MFSLRLIIKKAGDSTPCKMLMGEVGFEPTILSECAPKAHAYSSSATRPFVYGTLYSFFVQVRINAGGMFLGSKPISTF